MSGQVTGLSVADCTLDDLVAQIMCTACMA